MVKPVKSPIRKVPFCPKCGSSNVVKEIPTMQIVNSPMTWQWKCNDCGFMSQVFPERADYDVSQK